MTNPTDLVQLYILLSYEKLQRATISQRQRPIEGSLRNRLLVWRFLKKIENEPISLINSAQEFLVHEQQKNSSGISNANPWFLDFNQTYDIDQDDQTSDQNNSIDTDIDNTNGLAMDIDTDIVAVFGNDDLNDSTCETMNIEQTSDVSLFLKRAIGAERRQKVVSEHFHPNHDTTYQSDLHLVSTDSTYEDTEQFFHDLCAELTNTTAALVSSTTSNVLNFSSSPEQTLIH